MLTPSRNILNYMFSMWHQLTSGKDLVHGCELVCCLFVKYISIHIALEYYLWSECLRTTYGHLLEHIINSWALGLKMSRNTMVLIAGKKVEINDKHLRNNLSDQTGQQQCWFCLEAVPKCEKPNTWMSAWWPKSSIWEWWSTCHSPSH